MSPYLKSSLNVTFLTLSLAITSCAGWNPNQPAEAKSKSQETVAAFKKRDSSMQAFFNKAYGYAVFPTVGKGAMGIGGAHGQGSVFRRGNMTGSTTLTQVTVGFQLGGQAYSQIIFFKDKPSFQNFKNGNLKFSAQATAVAATAGAAATADYENGVAVFTMIKGGLMYEASIGGQGFSYTPLN